MAKKTGSSAVVGAGADYKATKPKRPGRVHKKRPKHTRKQAFFTQGACR